MHHILSPFTLEEKTSSENICIGWLLWLVLSEQQKRFKLMTVYYNFNKLFLSIEIILVNLPLSY